MNVRVSEATVKAVNTVYHYMILNLYFVLANSLLLAELLVFRLTFNNLILFVLPFFFFLTSVNVFFKLMNRLENTGEVCRPREYLLCYKQTLKTEWKVLLAYLGTFLLLFLDFHFLLSLEKGVLLLLPLCIASVFFINGLLFSFWISADNRAVQYSIKERLIQSLLISYKLPGVSILNIGLLLISMAVFIYYPLLSIAFISGLTFHLILQNIKRKFSVALYFEEIKQ